MPRKVGIQAAVIVSMLCIFLYAAGPSHAAILAATDFGTTDGTNISPFTTDYSPMPMDGTNTSPDHYYVAKSGNGYPWSSQAGDWGGVDHTTGTGCFMVVDGSGNSSHAIVSYTVNNAAAGTYTLTGYAMEVQSWDGPDAKLALWVNGVPQPGPTFNVPGHWNWYPFTFTYTATSSGPTTFALHDNETSTAMNDFGLDDLKLTGPNPVPEPCTMLLLGSGLAGLGFIRRRWNLNK